MNTLIVEDNEQLHWTGSDSVPASALLKFDCGEGANALRACARHHPGGL